VDEALVGGMTWYLGGTSYEYACNDGNVGLYGILAGARADEQKGCACRTSAKIEVNGSPCFICCLLARSTHPARRIFTALVATSYYCKLPMLPDSRLRPRLRRLERNLSEDSTVQRVR
jgi:hypothetical protein